MAETLPPSGPRLVQSPVAPHKLDEPTTRTSAAMVRSESIRIDISYLLGCGINRYCKYAARSAGIEHVRLTGREREQVDIEACQAVVQGRPVCARGVDDERIGRRNYKCSHRCAASHEAVETTAHYGPRGG